MYAIIKYGEQNYWIWTNQMACVEIGWWNFRKKHPSFPSQVPTERVFPQPIQKLSLLFDRTREEKNGSTGMKNKLKRFPSCPEVF